MTGKFAGGKSFFLKRETNMHSGKWVSMIIATGILGSLSLGSSVSWAQNKEKTVKPDTITCEEFLAMDKDVQPQVVYWMMAMKIPATLRSKAL